MAPNFENFKPPKLSDHKTLLIWNIHVIKKENLDYESERSALIIFWLFLIIRIQKDFLTKLIWKDLIVKENRMGYVSKIEFKIKN